MKRRWIAVLSLLLACASLTCGQAPPASGNTAAEAISAAPLPGTSTVSPRSSGSVHCADQGTETESSRFWLNADYLHWWIKGTSTPPLVTTGSAPDPFAGALDQPNTRVLFGGEEIDCDGLSGLRVSTGMWLNEERGLGVEGSYFFLERGSNQASFNSGANGEPLVTRPFIDAISGLENAYFSGISAQLAGSPLIGGVSVSTDIKVRGCELNLVRPLSDGDGIKLTGLVGFRGLVLKEDVTVRETSRDDVGGGLIFLGELSVPGTTQHFIDTFETHNRFYGGQVGVRADWQRDKLGVSVTGKLALGSNEEITFISGSTTQLSPGVAPVRVPGGVLAQSTNIGRHFDRDFAIVPELGINVSYDAICWLNVRAGYSYLYWSRVERAGDQIDRTINTNIVPTDPAFGLPDGPNRPAIRHDKSDFWMHGINLGVEVKF